MKPLAARFFHVDRYPSLAGLRWRRALMSVGLVTRVLACTLLAMALLGVPAHAQVAPVAPSGMRPIQLAYDDSNISGVLDGARSPTINVPFPKVFVVQHIWTYHWHGGQGDAPGFIGLRDRWGNVTWWKATGTSGSGGAPNVNWDVYDPQDLNGGPFMLFWQNGPYAIVDSSQILGLNTWSWNSQSGGFGFFKIFIY